MRKWIIATILITLLFSCVCCAFAEEDKFEITDVITEESSPEYWKLKLFVKNNLEETVHNLQLSVCFTDKDDNIIYTSFPDADVRVKAGKTIAIETLIAKATNPYAVYVDQIEYDDSNEEHKKTYLNNTKEFIISE